MKNHLIMGSAPEFRKTRTSGGGGGVEQSNQLIENQDSQCRKETGDK